MNLQDECSTGEEVIKNYQQITDKVFIPVEKSNRRIGLMFAAGMLLGLLFATASFTAWQWFSTERTLYCFTASQAKLISSNVQVSLAFKDSKDAKGVLDSLKTQRSIAFGCIYDCNGKLFASYSRDDLKGIKPPPVTKARFHRRNGYTIISEPVIVENSIIGTVCLWSKS